MCLVQVIAERAHRLDSRLLPDEEGERFYGLWLAADERDRRDADTTNSYRSVLPVYLVAEESAAIAGTPVAALNVGITDLYAEIASNPAVADKARFCVIGFAAQAHVLLPLSEASEISAAPELAAEGNARYGAAFELLRVTIDQDARKLLAEGRKLLRPAVFFIAASPPADPKDWQASYDRLTSLAWRYHPNIMAFGFGGADRDTIHRIATIRAFASPEINPALILREYAQSLIMSIAKSGTSPGPDGGLRLVMPDGLPGFTVINVDSV
jgi:uncharacterized protein YegL